MALNPFDPADGATNFETLVGRDNNYNYHEYWNGSDPWSFDPATPPAVLREEPARREEESWIKTSSLPRSRPS